MASKRPKAKRPRLQKSGHSVQSSDLACVASKNFKAVSELDRIKYALKNTIRQAVGASKKRLPSLSTIFDKQSFPPPPVKVLHCKCALDTKRISILTATRREVVKHHIKSKTIVAGAAHSKRCMCDIDGEYYSNEADSICQHAIDLETEEETSSTSAVSLTNPARKAILVWMVITCSFFLREVLTVMKTSGEICSIR